MSSLSFRTATKDDTEAIVALVTSAYRGDSSRAGWTTEADLIAGSRVTPELIHADIDRERSEILLVERDGELIACGHIEDQDGAGYLGMFSVKPTLQGGGIGKLVLAEAERVAHERLGLKTMRMTVLNVRTELLAFYERRGYRPSGASKPFHNDERFGKPLVDNLAFVVIEKVLGTPEASG